MKANRPIARAGIAMIAAVREGLGRPVVAARRPAETGADRAGTAPRETALAARARAEIAGGMAARRTGAIRVRPMSRGRRRNGRSR
jgi:hypothetical protein